MNKQWYSFGSPFKEKFRKHYCYKCGFPLVVIKHEKMVWQNTEEAKFYSFNAPSGHMVGPCEFIHDIFYCQRCPNETEFITQFSLEDIDILIKKIQRHYDKKGQNIEINKYFEMRNGQLKNYIDKIENITNLCIFIKIDEAAVTYKVPISRKNVYERPYYFKLSKKEIIKFIDNQKKPFSEQQ